MDKYLRSFNILTENEIAEVLELVTHKALDKNTYFIREGEVCKKVAFIISGIFRSLYVSSADEEVTYCFMFPNSFVAAYSSFITQEASFESIQAITPTEALVIPKYEIDRLITESKNWLHFFKVMAEQQYIALEKRVFQLQRETAEKRYLHLLENHPDYIQQIPLHYLASYLGITQRHLSRLRKQISI